MLKLVVQIVTTGFWNPYDILRRCTKLCGNLRATRNCQAPEGWAEQQGKCSWLTNVRSHLTQCCLLDNMAPSVCAPCISLWSVSALKNSFWEDKFYYVSQRVNVFCDSMRRQKGTAVAQWLRCCATYRKVTGSIPAGVSGFFINIESFRSRYGPGSRLSL
jgi:hypothetical protein